MRPSRAPEYDEDTFGPVMSTRRAPFVRRLAHSSVVYDLVAAAELPARLFKSHETGEPVMVRLILSRLEGAGHSRNWNILKNKAHRNFVAAGESQSVFKCSYYLFGHLKNTALAPDSHCTTMLAACYTGLTLLPSAKITGPYHHRSERLLSPSGHLV